MSYVDELFMDGFVEIKLGNEKSICFDVDKNELYFIEEDNVVEITLEELEKAIKILNGINFEIDYRNN